MDDFTCLLRLHSVKKISFRTIFEQTSSIIILILSNGVHTVWRLLFQIV